MAHLNQMGDRSQYYQGRSLFIYKEFWVELGYEDGAWLILVRVRA